MLTAKKQSHTKPTLTQFPLRVRRHHAAFEGTQQRVVANADDPCCSVGCQPVRQDSLSEGQNLEVHHVMPGPRLNGGRRRCCLGPCRDGHSSSSCERLVMTSFLCRQFFPVLVRHVFAQHLFCVAPAGLP